MKDKKGRGSDVRWRTVREVNKKERINTDAKQVCLVASTLHCAGWGRFLLLLPAQQKMKGSLKQISLNEHVMYTLEKSYHAIPSIAS